MPTKENSFSHYRRLSAKRLNIRPLTKLTPRSRVLPEKLTAAPLVRKFPTFYGSRRFITVFTRARHLSLSLARSIQSMPLSPFSKIHLNIILPSTPGSFKWSPSLRFPHWDPICMHLSSSPYVLHALPKSVVLIWSSEWHFARSKKHKAPRYVVFSTSLLPRPS